jgi:hypothetical protein
MAACLQFESYRTLPISRNDGRDFLHVRSHFEFDLQPFVYLHETYATFIDHCVGRLLDALDAGPHPDNTIIVL